MPTARKRRLGEDLVTRLDAKWKEVEALSIGPPTLKEDVIEESEVEESEVSKPKNAAKKTNAQAMQITRARLKNKYTLQDVVKLEVTMRQLGTLSLRLSECPFFSASHLMSFGCGSFCLLVCVTLNHHPWARFCAYSIWMLQ